MFVQETWGVQLIEIVIDRLKVRGDKGAFKVHLIDIIYLSKEYHISCYENKVSHIKIQIMAVSKHSHVQLCVVLRAIHGF